MRRYLYLVESPFFFNEKQYEAGEKVYFDNVEYVALMGSVAPLLTRIGSSGGGEPGPSETADEKPKITKKKKSKKK